MSWYWKLARVQKNWYDFTIFYWVLFLTSKLTLSHPSQTCRLRLVCDGYVVSDINFKKSNVLKTTGIFFQELMNLWKREVWGVRQTPMDRMGKSVLLMDSYAVYVMRCILASLILNWSYMNNLVQIKQYVNFLNVAGLTLSKNWRNFVIFSTMSRGIYLSLIFLKSWVR